MRTINWIGIILMLGGAGLVHGMWSRRRTEEKNLPVGKDWLSKLEEISPEWQLGDTLTLNAADLPEKTQTQSRQVIGSPTIGSRGNRSAVVSLTSGAPGIVAVHTPDICYLGSGYKLKGLPKKEVVPLANGGTATFWVADFEKGRASGTETIRVRWSWTANGVWDAPDYPRWAFFRSSILYKLYIVHPVTDETDLTKEEAYRTLTPDLASALSRMMTRDSNK